ncbi:MAG: hypothetical protein R3B07_34585 [Polyangiaceae bacterium]
MGLPRGTSEITLCLRRVPGGIALITGALLITAWLVRAWYRPGRHETKETDERRSIPSGKTSGGVA